MTIAQGKISLDDWGCAYSPEFGDVYASNDGAYEQSRFVFLGGNRLPERWQGKAQFTIVENGFGLGTNFLTTLKAWREDPKRSGKLFYLAIEGFPLQGTDIKTFASSALRAEAEELAYKWSTVTPGVHRLTFDGGRVVLDLYFMPASAAAKKLPGAFDAFYPDGFSPKKNPEMWEPRLLKAICSHAKEDATLATWCVASAVRKAFNEAGFTIQKVPGFGHKSEMTVGRFEPKFKHRRSTAFLSTANEPQTAIVIGAGLAGSAVACELASRGVKVQVIDAGPVGASGASALRWGVVHAQPSGDDNQLFRLTRSGLEKLQEELSSYPELVRTSGLFQMARDEGELQKWQQWFAQSKPFAFPNDFLRLMSAEEAKSKIGLKPRLGGLWHEGAGIVAVAEWVRARLNRSGTSLLLNTRVGSLSKHDQKWQAKDAFRQIIAEADVVVVCCAAETANLLPGIELPLTRWKGRLSLLCDGALADLKGAVTGPGYAIHSPDSWIGVGATYESSDKQMSPQEAHLKNLSHLKDLFPQLSHADAAGFYEGFRCVAPDRLPVVGQVSATGDFQNASGIYVSCAMGSRGTVFNELAAKVIAAQMFNEPIPLEADLLRAIDPSRFLKKSR